MKIPNWIKQSFRFALKDKVYSILAALMVIVAALDLFTSINMTGGYGFFALVFISALLKIGYLQWRVSELDGINFKSFSKMSDYVTKDSDEIVDFVEFAKKNLKKPEKSSSGSILISPEDKKKYDEQKANG